MAYLPKETFHIHEKKMCAGPNLFETIGKCIEYVDNAVRVHNLIGIDRLVATA